MSKIILGALLFVCVLSVNAQDFRPGFIIKSSGDSVKGFLAYRSASANEKGCSFKLSSEASEKTEFGPSQLKGFGFDNDRYYESRWSVVDGKKTRVFFEVLVTGSAGLLLYQGQFYLLKDSLTLLPKETMQTVNANGSSYLQKTSKYKRNLAYELSGCGINIDNVDYSERSLVKVVERYNACKGKTQTVYKSSKPWTAVSLLAFVSAEGSNIKMEGFDNYDFPLKVKPGFGLGVEICSPRIAERLSFVAEIWYSKKNYKGHKAGLDNDGYYVDQTVTAATTEIKIPIGLKYMVWKNLYAKVGFVESILSKPTGSATFIYEFNGTSTTDTQDVPFIKKNLAGFWGGIGYSKKISNKLSGVIEFRFQKTKSTPSPFDWHISQSNAVSLVVGIRY